MPEQMNDEQMKALQEKLKKMSPDELKEFQKQQCIFCQIISKKVNSKIIFEDDKSLAILDINPANPGHVLLMPKEHYAIMPTIPEDIIRHLSMVAKALSQAMLKSLGIEGTTIFIANGAAAGQRAQHFMIHIVPRKEKDGLPFDIPKHTFPEDHINKIRQRLVEKINETMKPEKKISLEEKPKEKEESPKKDKPSKKTKKKKKKSKKKKQVKENKEEKHNENKDIDVIEALGSIGRETDPERETKEITEEDSQESQDTENKKEVSLDDIAGLFK